MESVADLRGERRAPLAYVLVAAIGAAAGGGRNRRRSAALPGAQRFKSVDCHARRLAAPPGGSQAGVAGALLRGHEDEVATRGRNAAQTRGRAQAPAVRAAAVRYGRVLAKGDR